MKPKFENIYSTFAKLISQRSECKRLQVGCIITSDDYSQIYSIGYNGGPKKQKHKCTNTQGNCGCVHAETNALIKCGVSKELDKCIFLTHSPCKLCATLIVNLGGVKRVFINQYYRDKKAINILTKAKIKVKLIKQGRV